MAANLKLIATVAKEMLDLDQKEKDSVLATYSIVSQFQIVQLEGGVRLRAVAIAGRALAARDQSWGFARTRRLSSSLAGVLRAAIGAPRARGARSSCR